MGRLKPPPSCELEWEGTVGTHTAVFRQLVSDHMRSGMVAVATGMTCAEAVLRMSDLGAGVSSVVVTDADGLPLGIVTERDVARRITYQLAPETPVERAMSQPLLTVREDDLLFHAVATMRRHDLRHMPVVDGAGALVGMLDLHAALAVTSAQMVSQIDRLTHAETLAGMQEVKAAQVEVADELFRDNVPAPEIQALLSHINRDLAARLTELCLREMVAAGLGPPPLDFCIIVMGSGGHGESYIFPNQDFGMIIADYPDFEHSRIDGWFMDLGTRLADALDAVGVPYCKGGVMTHNPLWRKSLSQWREQISSEQFSLEFEALLTSFRGRGGRVEFAEAFAR